ncbi:MAG: hypothetical protein UV82_C0009G0083 [Candidatus Magasanikbacteria bacterium GW2011_GWD2_43_18]|uniref:Uncharacterized protein n=1 Tax=Candidatus Magasanikbacteria bacterium GW2011_GWE2_42_7 TaxID=1619052 RepID=A0A0G1BC64_9BACT|nr:MAG: hypothetical protein UV18_C0004G0166 [Candidatus Magasanikbacteria bacterium GW2011_GWC2_42_27]KKS70877.1 MAG: hypothetical protein UV42_C0041G0004 [Candidatus Magasanikbacteria bacterium GW2011_GWE2_42_7]KKT04343.1 MAG: hypothetical protein UV82_C0009G0083 [Candidatus Magasanikbacteria bacterium GW2011_GWD2_43_18]KKT25339.1 MAG: hypothetical protein UW10_C0009G0022 [Candidatus Magasanikbacteria bacterium GW2011_GWA2_43_9]HBB38049.1 hypothetical protein [Candidatus Magasanikbacteria bac
MNFIYGLLGVALGASIVIKSEWIVQNFGTYGWAEEHLGSSGGSRLFYKLIGLVIILFSLLSMAGLMDNILLGIFGKLFTGFAS